MKKILKVEVERVPVKYQYNYKYINNDDIVTRVENIPDDIELVKESIQEKLKHLSNERFVIKQKK